MKDQLLRMMQAWNKTKIWYDYKATLTKHPLNKINTYCSSLIIVDSTFTLRQEVRAQNPKKKNQV